MRYSSRLILYTYSCTNKCIGLEPNLYVFRDFLHSPINIFCSQCNFLFTHFTMYVYLFINYPTSPPRFSLFFPLQKQNPIVLTVMAYGWRHLSQNTDVCYSDFGRYVLRNFSTNLPYYILRKFLNT